ncbi:hypothetical protein IQ07DRAFT_649727 [Pyrenochaeta sp. DS3sAY3a]|nr:hypothetical protein IQ07DRAFT_649727 [Pyrenochaeta sp. DS3sAY3a]
MRHRRPQNASRKENEESCEPVRSEPGSIEHVDGSNPATSPFPRPTPPMLRAHIGTIDGRQMPTELLIDRLLFQDSTSTGGHDQSVVMASNNYVPSSTLAFFSEDKIKSLSNQLKHDRLHDLIYQIDGIAAARFKAFRNISASSLLSVHVTDDDLISAPKYIQAYFENIHPLYPFLNRHQVEELASRHAEDETLSTDPTWSALYYGVLCLGSLYCDEGSFVPTQGTSWKFFAVALKLLPELLLIRRTLRTAQALTVMAIYGQTFASLPVDETPITEAARIAVSLGLGKHPRPGTPEDESKSLFWVIYCMEKDFSFNVTRSSLINDHDVGCSLPSLAADGIHQINWIKTWAIFSRLLSKAYDALFSLDATSRDDETSLHHIDSINIELDNWQKSIPRQLRPGNPIQPHKLGNTISITLAVKIHFYYYNTKIALARLCLRICRGVPSARDSSSKRDLLTAARSIIETIHYVEVEPFTPGWILAHVPTVAVFILFDFTVHNPCHPETDRNLALLNVAAGYFARVNIHLGPKNSSRHLIELINIASAFAIGSQRMQHGNPLEAESSNTAANDAGVSQISSQSIPESPRNAHDNSTSAHSDFMDDTMHNSSTDYSCANFSALDQGAWSDLQSIDSLIYPVDLGLFMNSDLHNECVRCRLFQLLNV